MLTPVRLGAAVLDKDTVRADKKTCRRFGPCGVGQYALYLNSIFLDRRMYLPLKSVRRVFKRIAMSKGGFTGQGAFGTMSYLVVEFDKGEQRQFRFKHEEDVDHMIAYISEVLPKVPTHSKAAEERLHQRDVEEATRYLEKLTPEAEHACQILRDGIEKLETEPSVTSRLATASKNMRINQRTNPAYKWVALAICIIAIIAAAFGIQKIVTHDNTGIYYTLLGLAALFMFSSAQVLPTARNNRKHVTEAYERAEAGAFNLVGNDFVVPCHYAHPVVLKRMERIIREGRAQSTDEAFEVLKADLKAMTADVQVSQEDYDEVVVIKPMFLMHDYE